MKRWLAIGGVLALGCLAGAGPTASALAAPAADGPAAPARVLQAMHASPVTITIRTVPPLAGVRLTFDGFVLVTGAHGEASHTEPHNFSRHTLRLVHTDIHRPGRRYRFARWAGQRDPNQAFLPTVRGLPMRASYTVTAAFAVNCPVTPHFSYQQGGALDPARISAVTVRTSTGQERALSTAGPTWLACQDPVYRDGTLSSRSVRYSVQSIMVGGTNVTTAGAQRFQPDTSPRPTLVGYFHNLTITAHDALFGGPTGSEAVLTMPDLSVRTLALGPGHTITLRSLPQGEYQVEVKAGSSQISQQSVRLSRDQVVNLTAVSRADLATVGGILIIILAGIPLLSRQRRTWVLGHARHLRTDLVRRLRKGDASA